MFCLICRHGLPRIVSPPTSASGSALSFPLVSPSFPARLRHSRGGGNPATRIPRDTCPWARERQPSLALRPSLGYRVS